MNREKVEKVKRSLSETSPDNPPSEIKKNKSSASKMGSVDHNLDSFLVRMEKMLEDKLDQKLKNIATKDDIATVHESINALKKENEELRNELNQLKERENRLMKRIEEVDKANRRTNIVVSGIEGGDINDIQ